MRRVLTFVIAYNEEAVIRRVIDDVRLYAPYSDIVIVDDCSTDGTANIARDAGVPVISHLVNSGTAGYAAVKTAMIYAFIKGYDVCCQVDGDGQHMAEYLSRIAEPVLEGRADLVIGSRFLGETGYRPTFARTVGIKVFSWITSLIIGQRIHDVSSGFKANSRKIINLYANYPHTILDTNEMLIWAHRSGGRILEVPVKMAARESGRSWYSLSKYLLYPIRTMLYIVAVIVRKSNV